jgi:hypothetical protein
MVSLNYLKRRANRPMSLKQINLLMEDFDSDYHLEELETGEIVMVRNNVPPKKKQSQTNLFEHLKEKEE